MSTVKEALASLTGWAAKTLESGPPPFGERDKQKDMWFNQFWAPLYKAACALPYSEYNTTMKGLEGLARQVVDNRGLDFAPAWYALNKGQLALSEDAYMQRRAELGCSAPKKTSKVWYIAGGLALVGATALVMTAMRGGR